MDKKEYIVSHASYIESQQVNTVFGVISVQSITIIIAVSLENALEKEI